MILKNNHNSRARRRNHKRIHLKLSLRVSGRDESGFSFVSKGETSNVSGQGGCLKLDKYVKRGTTLRLSDDKGHQFTADVRWSLWELTKDVRYVGFKLTEGTRGWILKDCLRGRPL